MPAPSPYSLPAFEYMFDAQDLGTGYTLTNQEADAYGKFLNMAFSPRGLQQVSWRLLTSEGTAVVQFLAVYLTIDDAKSTFHDVVNTAVLPDAYDIDESVVELGDETVFVVYMR